MKLKNQDLVHNKLPERLNRPQQCSETRASLIRRRIIIQQNGTRQTVVKKYVGDDDYTYLITGDDESSDF